MQNKDKVYVFTAFSEDVLDFETKAFENYKDAQAHQYDWLKRKCEYYDIYCPETLDAIKDDDEDLYRYADNNDFVCVNAGYRMSSEREYSQIIETEIP